MQWRELLELPDGGRVESRLLPARDEAGATTAGPRYRLARPGAAPVLFANLADVTAFLVREYDITDDAGGRPADHPNAGGRELLLVPRVDP